MIVRLDTIFASEIFIMGNVTMRLMPTQTNTQLFYNMDATKLRTVPSSVKDLGVITGNEFTFKEHTFEGC